MDSALGDNADNLNNLKQLAAIYKKKSDDMQIQIVLFLLRHDEYVEIIEPVEARNILKEKAKKIFSMY